MGKPVPLVKVFYPLIFSKEAILNYSPRRCLMVHCPARFFGLLFPLAGGIIS
jgi:hypothetical protein